jgi:hypothetical protein
VLAVVTRAVLCRVRVRCSAINRHSFESLVVRNGAPFKDWDLPPALTQVRAKLKQHADGDRQFVKVLGAVLDHGLAAVEAACAEALRGRHRQRRCDPDRAGAPPAARGAAQHHNTRRASPQDRTHGRLWPLRQHKEDRLMERHEILEAMSELKLYGMRASFDEIAGKGLARRDEIYPLIASLLRAERTHRQARSISYRIVGAKFPPSPQRSRQVRLRRYAGR